MGEEIIQDKCGVFLAYSLHDVYNMMKESQHRGRGGAGITGIGDGKIDALKWVGNVSSFDVKDMYKILPAKNHYHFFMGHVRYPTKGKKENSAYDAHPHTIGGRVYERAGHIIIEGAEAAIVHNGQVDEKYLQDIDKLKLKTNCDSEALLHFYREHGEKDIIRKIPGAYTAIIADIRRNEAMIIRDKVGIKPGSIGWKDGKYQAASEDKSIVRNGGKTIEEIIPGSIYYFDVNGDFRREIIASEKRKFCFFEFNYLSHHESTIEGAGVNNIRYALGERAGLEFKKTFENENIDYVGYLPRCPEPAANGFSSSTNFEFLDIFYKMKDERAFQGPNHDERKKSIEKNLNLTPEALRKLPGKNVVVVDDSIVRGTNIKQAAKLLYGDAKVKKAFFVSYTPPIGIIGEDNIERGCEFGVDMPKDDTFIIRNKEERRNKTIEEISKEVGMAVFYLSKENMEEVYNQFGLSLENMCHHCIGGERPF